jgi:hypothetical protein
MRRTTGFWAGLRRTLTRVLIVFLIIGTLGYVATGVLIGRALRSSVAHAQAEFGGEPVEALLQLATSRSSELSTRNRAIWALGQLGDVRALPTLEDLYDGEPCNHSERLCQRELRKAMGLCNGGLNLAAPVWKLWALVGE